MRHLIIPTTVLVLLTGCSESLIAEINAQLRSPETIAFERALANFQSNYPDVTLVDVGIWIDPNNCLHMLGDDGTQRYLAALKDTNGAAICDP